MLHINLDALPRDVYLTKCERGYHSLPGTSYEALGAFIRGLRQEGQVFDVDDVEGRIYLLSRY